MRGRQSLTAPSLLSPCSLRSHLRRPMRHGGGEERKKRFAERSLRAALPHEGASEPAADTCCLSPVWNTGCLCGNVRCRPCRSKGTLHAQSHQHNSTTERGSSFPCTGFTRGEQGRRRQCRAVLQKRRRPARKAMACPNASGFSARLRGWGSWINRRPLTMVWQ